MLACAYHCITSPRIQIPMQIMKEVRPPNTIEKCMVQHSNRRENNFIIFTCHIVIFFQRLLNKSMDSQAAIGLAFEQRKPNQQVNNLLGAEFHLQTIP